MPVSAIRGSDFTYGSLLARGRAFRAPRFQRGYAWGEEQWEDLWQDIVDLADDPGTDMRHMGCLTLRERPDGFVDIVDGQQRMATLSLFVLAGLRAITALIDDGIEPEDNGRRLDALRRTYVADVDPASFAPEPRLVLNRNDDYYYQRHIVPLGEMPRMGIKGSSLAMRRATNWFGQGISERFERAGLPAAGRGRAVAELIEAMAGGLRFTVISVEDEEDAYRAFASLDSPGARLSAPDLVKSRLLSVVSGVSRHGADDASLDLVERPWSNVVDRLRPEDVAPYLATYWNAKRGFARPSGLFGAVGRGVAGPVQAHELLSGLEESVETYAALVRPWQSDWPESDRENVELLHLFGARQPFALLLAAKEGLPDGFARILEAVVDIAFRRDVICGLRSLEQDRAYSAVAVAITRGELSSADDAIRALEPIYPDDEAFRESFEARAFDTSGGRNRLIVRYVLAKLEARESGAPFAWPPREVVIEHILSENPEEDWPQFSAAEEATETYRIGNMMLIEESLNREAGNLPFSGKRPIYARSRFTAAQAVSGEREEWSRHSVQCRQRQLAKTATAIWRVSQLHES